MKKREPNFENIKKVLTRQVPERPVLFELFMDGAFCSQLTGQPRTNDEFINLKQNISAYSMAGYDYATTHASRFRVSSKPRGMKDTLSLNENPLITDWESFESFEWNDPSSFSTEKLARIKCEMPDGMKLMIMGPGGILENVIELMGYDNLCMALYDEPDLVKEVVDHVGKRMLTYYETALQYDTVGMIASNDDWGFNTQTFLSPQDMRKYIFPWHKRIVDAAHRQNKLCILHSCGYFEDIIDDVIDDMGYDGRHSYEDNIMPVEEAYEKYNSRIAVLGGMDVDFLCRKTPEEITKRAKEMLERSKERGGYALGTGNSLAHYIPLKNYFAMTRAALD